MCISDFKAKGFIEHKPKVCIKFVFITEDDCRKMYFVNISPFESNGEVALCQILLHLGSKDLNVFNKKLYLAEKKMVFQAESRCKCRVNFFSQKQLHFKIYSGEQNENDIINQNQYLNADEWINNKKPNNEQDVCYCMAKTFAQDNASLLSNNNSVDVNFQYEQQQSNQFRFDFFPTFFYNSQFYNIMKFPQQKYSFQLKNLENETSQKENSSSPSSSKRSKKAQVEQYKQQKFPKQKIKEYQRKIKEVIILVKTWRLLHKNKVCSLKHGATLLKLPKKSLDDYYLVLRTGQVLGFDFANQLGGKMGDLRAFIRRSQHKVTGKLNNHVQCFSLVKQLDIRIDQNKQTLFTQQTQEKFTTNESLKQIIPKITQINKKVVIPIPIIKK